MLIERVHIRDEASLGVGLTRGHDPAAVLLVLRPGCSYIIGVDQRLPDLLERQRWMLVADLLLYRIIRRLPQR